MAVLKYKENGVWKNLSFVATQGDTVDLGGYVQKSELLDLIYPVGSIYMSVNSTSPATLFGGTWEQLKDRFILAAGDSYTAGNTGGANNISINTTTGGHTITQEELPNRTMFSYNMADSSASSGSGISWGSVAKANYVATCNQDAINQWKVQTLQNQPHSHSISVTTSNMPPYLVVYIWKRTA